MVTRCSCCWQCEQNGLYGSIMTKPAMNKIAMNFSDVHFMGTLSCVLEITIYLVYLKNTGKRRDFSYNCFIICHCGDIGNLLLNNPLVILRRIDVYQHTLGGDLDLQDILRMFAHDLFPPHIPFKR